MKRPLIGLLISIFLAVIAYNCKISYSTTGASIPPEVKTVSVDFFKNRAQKINPQLAPDFTETLRDKIQSQTRLKLTNEEGDVHFTGEITKYRTRPVSPQGNQQAAKSRLTVSVHVKYTNSVKPEQNFDKTFSQYEDYESTKSLSSVEAELTEIIVDKLTEDIFNEAFVNW